MVNCTATIRSDPPPRTRSPGTLITEGVRLVGQGLGLALRTGIDALLERMDRARAYRHLHELDDRMLADIGVSRADLDRLFQR